MKNQVILILFTIGLLTLLSSCLNKTVRLQQNSARVESGMDMEEVVSLLGEAQNRQLSGDREVWQYCESSTRFHYYSSVAFDKGIVNSVSVETKDSKTIESCKRCEQCFDKIAVEEIVVSHTGDRFLRIGQEPQVDNSKKEGKWVKVDKDELKALKNMRSQKVKKNEPSLTKTKQLELDTIKAEDRQFIEGLSQTELVRIVGNFEPGSSIPLMSDSTELLYLVDKINSSKYGTYLLVGHTNSQGNDLTNLKLSKARAFATLEILLENYGLVPDKLIFGGAGEELPFAVNNTKDGRSENSRVELRSYIK